ncbi:MAG: hypothetical protein AAFZ18_34660 [Myxococcota bacterium]
MFRLRRIHRRLGCAGAAVLFSVAHASSAADAVVERLDHAQIDWSSGEIVATGSGAPKLDLGNVAKVRLEAERAAKLDAYRHVLEALEGVRVTVSASGRDRLAQPRVRTTVQGLLSGCSVKDTRYYSDGGVDVVLRCPFKGGLATALAPTGPRTQLSEGGETKITGLILDASGVGARPVLIPTVEDGQGRVILGPKILSEESLRRHGGVAYAASVEEAKTHERVGATPVTVRVSTASGKGWTLAPGEADKLAGLDLGFVAEGSVVVVMSGSAGAR